MHHLFVRDLPWYDDRARGLIEAAADRVPAALAQLRVALPDDARADALSLDEARLVYARQHGFGDWTALATRLEALAAGAEPEPFARAFEAIEARDRPRLE